MKISLVVLNVGKASGQAIPITTSEFVIGRDPQCNLRPASVLISKRHCSVIVKNDKVSVRDYDSTNGTFVNNQQVKGEVPLKNGDLLKAGPLSFRVMVEGAVEKPAAPAPTAGAAATAGAATKKPTPVPKRGADEDAAALLLSLDEHAPNQGPIDPHGVPDGSTVMDMVVKLPTPQPPTKATPTPPPATHGAAPDTAAAPGASTGSTTAAPAPAGEKKEASKNATGAAQEAAKAILAKYSKRNR